MESFDCEAEVVVGDAGVTCRREMPSSRPQDILRTWFGKDAETSCEKVRQGLLAGPSRRDQAWIVASDFLEFFTAVSVTFVTLASTASETCWVALLTPV